MFQALEETADGQFRVLIGIDDSSEEDSIQKNEIAYLRAQLRQGDALLSGVDDLAFKAVTKLCLEEWGWEGAAVSVQYFGGTEDRPACAYDYQPLEAIVAEHFDFFDLTMAEPGGEELAMLVLTQPADPAPSGREIPGSRRASWQGRYQWRPAACPDRSAVFSAQPAIPHNCETSPCSGAWDFPRWTIRFPDTGGQRAAAERRMSPRSCGTSGNSQASWNCSRYASEYAPCPCGS